MFGKRKSIRLSREDEETLFALDEFIQKLAFPDRPTLIRHPFRMSKGWGNVDLTDEELDVIDAQNRIKKLLGIQNE